MFENPRRGRQGRNFTTNVPKILVLKSSPEQIFSQRLPLGAPEWSMLLQLFVDNTRLAMQKRLWILCFSNLNLEHAQYELLRSSAEVPSSSRLIEEDRRRLCSQGMIHFDLVKNNMAALKNERLAKMWNHGNVNCKRVSANCSLRFAVCGLKVSNREIKIRVYAKR